MRGIFFEQNKRVVINKNIKLFFLNGVQNGLFRGYIVRGISNVSVEKKTKLHNTAKSLQMKTNHYSEAMPLIMVRHVFAPAI
jgi:N-acetylneuraminic acid mutarotase